MRLVDLAARADFRDRDIPPMATGVSGNQRVGIDDGTRVGRGRERLLLLLLEDGAWFAATGGGQTLSNRALL